MTELIHTWRSGQPSLISSVCVGNATPHLNSIHGCDERSIMGPQRPGPPLSVELLISYH